MFGVSYAGAGGGLLGFGINLALGIAIAGGAGDASASWCIPFFGIALMFVPAMVASVRPAAHRNGIQRATVVGCLVAAGVGLVFFGPIFPFVMAPPTVLLAQAAGLIWQGPAKP